MDPSEIYNTYKQTKILGEGGCGVVSLLELKDKHYSGADKPLQIVAKAYKVRDARSDEIFKNEIRIMRKLSGQPHFPKLVGYDERKYEIYMEHCGERISHKNAPSDWKEQLYEILKILKRYKISHNSSAINNTVVGDGLIYFIDFGHSGEYRPYKRNLTEECIRSAVDIYDAYDSNKTRRTNVDLLNSHDSDIKNIERRKILLRRAIKRKELFYTKN